ncbi:hypothetical protein PTKIN_Ptkin14bG0222500 [Pterospermum kingtungense]
MFMLGKLSEDKCWSLFPHLAFLERTREEREDLENIGRKIVERCKGLPLAVKALGGLLRFRETKEQWQSILDSKMWEIEDVGERVFPPLLLSYYDLSPALRQCFSYCAIFPKDFKIQKKKLIKLWIAQGFVKQIGNKGMEIIGEEYFNNLATRSFFQDIAKEKCGEIYCEMHEIVHDFAQSLTGKECSLIEFDSTQKSWKSPSCRRIRHSLLMLERRASTFPIPMDNWKQMRTLLIEYNFYDVDPTSIESLLTSILDQVTCLRALDLSDDYFRPIRRLPDKIGKLIHLRCLNLSGNKFLETLPEAICDLCNLQTLDIIWCKRLTELPRGIGKLINLVYLENVNTWGFEIYAKRNGEVNAFEDTTGVRCEGWSVGRLSTLTGLRKLTLDFAGYFFYEVEAFVVEALQPPQNLETLEISCLKGSTLFPNWMTSLNMLKSVELSWCRKWESLPPMGKLPSLEKLKIFRMDKVKKVGEEFLGIERETSTSSSSSVVVSFPNLKTLEFDSLFNWEEWEYENISRSHGGGGGGQEDSSSITIHIMPRLQSLSNKHCPKLKAPPRHLLRNTEITYHRLPYFTDALDELEVDSISCGCSCWIIASAAS